MRHPVPSRYVAHARLLGTPQRGDRLDALGRIRPRLRRARVARLLAFDHAVDLELLEHVGEPGAAAG